MSYVCMYVIRIKQHISHWFQTPFIDVAQNTHIGVGQLAAAVVAYARNVKWLMALQFEAVAEAVLETTQCVKIFVS